MTVATRRNLRHGVLLFGSLVLSTIGFVAPRAAGQDGLSALRITVALADAERGVTPVARHLLLISDNPASAEPRRILTGADGTVVVRLRPGSYIVESDKPVAFQGKGYEWTQVVEIPAGRDVVLELTAANADTAAVPATAAPAPVKTTPAESAPSFLLTQWQDSVVTVWTPSIRASGFVVDARGLIATSHAAIGDATQIEVQLTPASKVAARVIASDSARDVAILWIDPKATGSTRPVPLGCDQATPSIVNGGEIFTIESPLRGEKALTSGTATRVTTQSITTDFDHGDSSAGGPVFTASGTVVGIVSASPLRFERVDVRAARIDAVCNVVASAGKAMASASAPDGKPLPTEPARPFSEEMLKNAAAGRTAVLPPYQVSSSDFDVAFITPVLMYAAQHSPERAAGREGYTRSAGADTSSLRTLMDFSNWSDYVADYPPVLLVRVTPRLVEGFWTKVGRAAVRTQGVALPPIKRFTSGFSRLRAFCGDTEVTPIHPFTLVQRVSESDAIREGLVVFDPAALGPHCGTVRLEIYSEKAPAKADSRVVDPKVIERIWQDFSSYRSAAAAQ
jgi:hypothetical protein